MKPSRGRPRAARRAAPLRLASSRPAPKRIGVFATIERPLVIAFIAPLGLLGGIVLGSAIASITTILAYIFMALFIARLGTASSAGHQVAANFTSLIYMMPLAMASATGVLTGQAIGAGDARRARLTGLVGIGSGLACAFVVALLVGFGRDGIAGLYTRDGEVQLIAASLLAYVAAYHLFDAASAIAVSALRMRWADSARSARRQASSSAITSCNAGTWLRRSGARAPALAAVAGVRRKSSRRRAG